LNHLSNRLGIIWTASIGAALGLILASFYLPGGDDLYRYYLPFAQGCLDCGFVPFYSQWFLLPLRILPDYPLTWGFWSIIVVGIFLFLASITRVNPLLLLVSFPMLGQVWLGQVDVLIVVGLVIFLFVKNPYIRGIGLILALAKPQLTFLPLAFTLLLEPPVIVLKLLFPPVAIFCASLMVFGWRWPALWLENVATALPIHVWRLASIDVWKFGVLLTPLPLLFNEKKERLVSGLLVSALATPFFGVYSYLVFLLFEIEWWHVLLSYAWLAGFGIWQADAMRLAWLLPLGMLAHMLYKKLN
jgi:hypothetical protein